MPDAMQQYGFVPLSAEQDGLGHMPPGRRGAISGDDFMYGGDGEEEQGQWQPIQETPWDDQSSTSTGFMDRPVDTVTQSYFDTIPEFRDHATFEPAASEEEFNELFRQPQSFGLDFGPSSSSSSNDKNLPTYDSYLNARDNYYEKTFNEAAPPRSQAAKPKPTADEKKAKAQKYNQDTIARAMRDAPPESASDYIYNRSIPFVSRGRGVMDGVEVIKAAERLRAASDAGQYMDYSDAQTIGQFLRRQKDAETAGFGESVLDIIAQIPAFLGEMGFGGTVAEPVKQGATRAAGKIIGKGLTSRAVGSAAGFTARIAANPALVAEGAVQRQLRYPDERISKSIALGTFQAAKEIGTELIGGKAINLVVRSLVGKPVGFLTKKLASSLASKSPKFDSLRYAVAKLWLKLHPENSYTEFAAKAASAVGWDGLLGEIGEERLGDLIEGLAGSAGIEGYDYGTLGGLFKNEPAAWRQQAIEAVAFSILPGASLAASGVAEAVTGPKKPSLSPDMAKEWAELNPVAATILADSLAKEGSASRRDFDAAGLPTNTSAGQRKAFAEAVANHLQQQQQQQTDESAGSAGSVAAENMVENTGNSPNDAGSAATNAGSDTEADLTFDDFERMTQAVNSAASPNASGEVNSSKGGDPNASDPNSGQEANEVPGLRQNEVQVPLLSPNDNAGAVENVSDPELAAPAESSSPQKPAEALAQPATSPPTPAQPAVATGGTVASPAQESTPAPREALKLSPPQFTETAIPDGFRLVDQHGGTATVSTKKDVASIVDWHSVPFAQRFTENEQNFKGRGFARAVIEHLNGKGITQFDINLQSADTRKVMARLIEDGTVSPVEGFERGGSFDTHPTRFAITQPEKPPVAEWVPADEWDVDPNAPQSEIEEKKSSRRKKAKEPITVARRIWELGGISIESSYNLREDFVQNGLLWLLNKTGRSLDDLALTLINEGHIAVPEDMNPADHVLHLLKNKGRVLSQDFGDKHFEDEYAQWVKDEEDARRNNSAEDVEEVRRINEEAGENEGHQKLLEGDFGLGDEALGGESEGEDASFDFGANVAETTNTADNSSPLVRSDAKETDDAKRQSQIPAERKGLAKKKSKGSRKSESSAKRNSGNQAGASDASGRAAIAEQVASLPRNEKTRDALSWHDELLAAEADLSKRAATEGESAAVRKARKRLDEEFSALRQQLNSAEDVAADVAPPKETAKEAKSRDAAFGERKPRTAKERSEPAKVTQQQLIDLISDPANYDEIAKTRGANGKPIGQEGANDLFLLLADPERVAARPSLLDYDPAQPFVPWAVRLAQNLGADDAKKQARTKLVGSETLDRLPAKKGLQKKDSLSKRAAKSRSEVLDALDEFGDTLRGGAGATGPFSPDALKGFAKLSAAIVKAGALTFADYTARLATLLTPSQFATWVPQMQSAFDAAMAEQPKSQSQSSTMAADEEFGDKPVATPKSASEPTGKPPRKERSPDDPLTTGTKNAKMEEMLAKHGLEPLLKYDAESVEGWLADATEQSKDSAWITGLLAELGANPRPITAVEELGLNLHGVKIDAKLTAAAESQVAAAKSGNDVAIVKANAEVAMVSAELDELSRITKAVGTLWGRSGRARQTELKSDFTPAGLFRKATISKGGIPPNAAETAVNLKLAARDAELQKTIAELQAKEEELQRQLEYERSHKEVQEEVAKDSVSPGRKAAKKRVESAIAKWKRTLRQQGMPGRTNTFGLGADLFADSVEVAKAYIALGVVTFKDFSRKLAKDAGQDISANTDTLKKAWDEALKTNPIDQRDISSMIDKEDPNNVAAIAKMLQRAFVESGMTARADVLAAVHAELAKYVPGITPDATMDAMSGYGKYSTLSREAVDSKIRELNGQYQQLAKLRDMQAGHAPLMTGQERREVGDEERLLIAQVNELKKKSGFALPAAKKAISNRIKDLQKEIDERTRNVKVRTDVTPDAELIALRAERDELRVRHKEIFGNRELTDTQRIAMAEKALDRAIMGLESDLKKNQLYPDKTGKKSGWSPAIAAKHARLDALRAQRQELRDIANPKMTEEERSNAAYGRAILKQIADYQQRIADGNFGPKAKPAPRKLPPELLSALAERNAIRSKFAKLQRGWEKSRQHWVMRNVVGPAVDIAAGIRAFWTSLDASLIRRQGGLLFAGHPILSAKAVPKYFASSPLKSKSVFATAEDELQVQHAIEANPNLQLYKSWGLELSSTTADEASREEGFNSQLAHDYIPGVAGSERGGTNFLNLQRIGVMDLLVEGLSGGTSTTDADGRLLANFVNGATGRGNLGLTKWKTAAAALAEVFLAPRWRVSRFNMITLQPLRKGLLSPKGEQPSAAARLIVAKEYARTISGLAAYYGTIASVLYAFIGPPGPDKEWEIYWDTRGSTFGKIRVKNTYIDPLSGLSQAIVFLTKLWKGETKRSNGVVAPIRGPQVPRGGTTALGVIGKFIQGGLAPVPQSAIEIATGTDFLGQPITPWESVTRRMVPMSIGETGKILSDNNVPTGVAISMLALIGEGANVYVADRDLGKVALLASQELSTEDKTAANRGKNKGLLKSEYEAGAQNDAVILSARQVLKSRAPSYAEQEALLESAWRKNNGGKITDGFHKAKNRLPGY